MKNVVTLAIALIIAFGAGYYIDSQQLFCGIECEAKMNKTQLISVRATEFADILDQDQATIIDVRTAEEYSAGHIEGAVNQDFYQTASFQEYLQTLDKDKPYMIYCRSGNRSGQTLEMMKEMGFTNIVDLDGGINSWQQAGLKIVKY